MDLKEIKAIIDLMKKSSVTEFELEQKEFKIKLKRGGNHPGEGDESSFYSARPVVAVPASLPHPPGPSAALPAPPVSNDAEIKSPMIGTFYRTPSPDAAPYVEVGVEVGPETVVCIIEAMKVMNEVKAETSGVIAEICAENGKPVQFGQGLFRLK